MRALGIALTKRGDGDERREPNVDGCVLSGDQVRSLSRYAAAANLSLTARIHAIRWKVNNNLVQPYLLAKASSVIVR
jgi:hypothetical protein